MENRYRLQLPEYAERIRDWMPGLVKILEQDLEEKAYGFAFYEETLERIVHAGRMESCSNNMDRGIVLRIVYNGKNYEAATNNLEQANLEQLAAELNTRVKACSEKPTFPVYKPRSWDEEDIASLCSETVSQIPPHADPTTRVHFGVLVSADPLKISNQMIMEQTRDLKNTLTRQDIEYCRKQKIKPLALVFVTSKHKVINHIFVDRVKNMSQSLPISLCVALGQTIKGRYGLTVCGGMGGPEVIQFSDEEFNQVLTIPHKLDNALFLKPGTYQVITGPDITGIFAHEAFGHTQEGDTCRQGRSITSQLQNVQVGNKLATIVNNAAVFSMESKEYGPNGSYYFDHEGELAREHIILEKGFLTPPMTDLLSAIHLGIRRTANGKRESWRRPTLTRQTNTYFTAGDKTLEELFAMVKGTGYLAIAPHGGMEDPKGANLTAGTEYFQEIVDGKLTGRYFLGSKGGHIELSGFVPDLLKGIKAKAKIDCNTTLPDKNTIPDNKNGGCGKFHKESVLAGSGGPYILWEQVICG